MNSKSLKIKLLDKNVTVKQLADLLQQSQQAVYAKIAGKRDFSCKELDKIKNFLNLSSQELYEIFIKQEGKKMTKEELINKINSTISKIEIAYDDCINESFYFVKFFIGDEEFIEWLGDHYNPFDYNDLDYTKINRTESQLRSSNEAEDEIINGIQKLLHEDIRESCKENYIDIIEIIHDYLDKYISENNLITEEMIEKKLQEKEKKLLKQKLREKEEELDRELLDRGLVEKDF